MTATRLFASVIILVFFACDAQDKTEDQRTPNIVYILADDLGYGDVSIYNPDSKISTPNIDNLARQGMRFTDAHSPSSVCTPTRYGVLTGRYCWRTRLPRGVLNGYGQALIENQEITVAELLQQKGYRTGVVGKWHLGLDWKIKEGHEDSLLVYGDVPILKNINSDWIDFNKPPSNGPLVHGFDYSYILPASLDMDPYCYLENDVLTEIPDAHTPGNDLDAPSWATGAFWRAGRMSPGFDFYGVLPTFIDKAKGFVKQRADKDQPFFLYLPLAAPHTPWVPTDEYEGKSSAGQYGDFVQMVDAHVGDFLSFLDEQNLSENTLVIFTSDNGPFWKPEFIERFDHRAAGALRGMKADAWEGGHRVPFVARWPGRIEAEAQSNQITTLTNFIATVAELTGSPLQDGVGMDSRSILPQLMGGAVDNSAPVVHHSSRGFFAVRSGDWKLIEGIGSGGFSQPPVVKPEPGQPTGQLYNLKEDIGETSDLFSENKEKVKELQGLLNEIKTAGK